MGRSKPVLSWVLFAAALFTLTYLLTMLVAAGGNEDEYTYFPLFRQDATPTPLPTITPTPTSTPTGPSHIIYMGQTLASGYDMGINSSGGLTHWVTDMNGYMCMAYPPWQSWGAVFITFGPPTNPPRPGQNLSAYRFLSLELRGTEGGEDVLVGIKDNLDPDNGSETKYAAAAQHSLTTNWQTYTWPLADFYTADLTRLYVVTEFVFEWVGSDTETVCFRNIKYLP